NGHKYRKQCNRLLAIGDEIAPNRRMRQEKYRRSKRLRHTMHLDDSVGDDSMTDMSEPENEWDDDDSVITHMSF
ncbi:hypothetical protein L916_17847, partial [Phytophthora nicotianae]